MTKESSMKMILTALILLPFTIQAKSTKDIDKKSDAGEKPVHVEKQQQQEARPVEDSSHWQVGPYDKNGNYNFLHKKEDKQPD